VPPERGGKVAQVRHPLMAAEPAGHVQVNQRGASSGAAGGTAESGGDADLAVRRGDSAVQPEVAQGIRNAQDEQRLRLVGPQAAQRKPVVLQEPAPPTRPGFGNDRDARRAERLQIPVDSPDGHLQLAGQLTRGHPTAGLQQQDQGHQTICSHPRRLTRGR
jgi:hypothetical protein